MATNEFRFRDAGGKAIGTQGWNADHDKSKCLTYTGLWRGRKVVALLVSKGEFDEMGVELNANGNFIVKACNSHNTFADALRAIAAGGDDPVFLAQQAIESAGAA